MVGDVLMAVDDCSSHHRPRENLPCVQASVKRSEAVVSAGYQRNDHGLCA